MISHAVEPRLGSESFSCPHCNDVAHQEWFSLLLKPIKQEELVRIIPDATPTSSASSYVDVKEQTLLEQFIERLKQNAVTYRTLRSQQASTTEMANLHLSHCYSCRGFAVWVEDRLVYPTTPRMTQYEPPPSLRENFQEAAAFADSSPGAAAALMRFCIQRMMPLSEQGKTLDDKIASLVSKGLETEIREATDALRVLSDDEAYPSQIEKDEKVLELLTSIVKRRG